MARASYQNLRGITFKGTMSKPAKQVERISLKPPVDTTAMGTETIVPIRPKPLGRTVLKLRTPLN